MLVSLFLAAATATAVAADSIVYPVLNHDRPAGTMVVTRNGDSVRVRYIFTDRNRGTRLEMREVFRGDAIVSMESRPVLADERSGDPTIRIDLFADSIRQTTPTRTSTEKALPGTYYTLTFTPYDQARLAKHLLRQPDHSAKVSATTTLRIDVVTQVTVPTAHGNERVRLVSLSNSNGASPQLIWLDSHDDLFATEVSWFMTIKPGAERALPTLRKLEAEYRDPRAESLNKSLVKSTSGTIAITNGDLFDSELGTIKPSTNVIIRNDRIVAVGPAESTPVPSGATVIDATGKTVLPGLWDMHGHMQTVSQSVLGVMELSFGLTTVRDLGSDPDVAISYRERANAGKLAVPRTILSGFIDGPGKWAGPTPNIVRTEDEARAFVAHFDSLGTKLKSSLEAYNLAVGSLEGNVLVKARKLKDLHAANGGEEIKALEPIDRVPRMLQAPELTGGLPFNDADLQVEEVESV